MVAMILAWLGFYKRPGHYGMRADLLRYERHQAAVSETEGWR